MQDSCLALLMQICDFCYVRVMRNKIAAPCLVTVSAGEGQLSRAPFSVLATERIGGRAWQAGRPGRNGCPVPGPIGCPALHGVSSKCRHMYTIAENGG